MCLAWGCPCVPGPRTSQLGWVTAFIPSLMREALEGTLWSQPVHAPRGPQDLVRASLQPREGRGARQEDR